MQLYIEEIVSGGGRTGKRKMTSSGATDIMGSHVLLEGDFQHESRKLLNIK